MQIWCDKRKARFRSVYFSFTDSNSIWMTLLYCHLFVFPVLHFIWFLHKSNSIEINIFCFCCHFLPLTRYVFHFFVFISFFFFLPNENAKIKRMLASKVERCSQCHRAKTSCQMSKWNRIIWMVRRIPGIHTINACAFECYVKRKLKLWKWQKSLNA